MTITTQTLRNDYTANGVNTSFAFTFPIFYESNATPKFSLEVILTDISGVETIKTETVDYTITYTTIENGIISQGNVVFNVAPTNQYKVTLLRKVNLTQNSEFTASGTDKFNGATLEASLDKLTLLALQTQENLNRVVKLPKSSALTNIEFPINSSVADEVICVNSTGDNLTTKNLIDVNLAPVSTYIKTLLNDTTSAEARATLEAQKLNNNLTALASLIGSSNKIPYFTGEGAMALTDIVSSASATTQGIQYLNKPITISNNIADANNDIDFTSGNFIFSDGSGSAIASAMTKRLDANWTAGNNNGGLDTGTKAANTWYYCYAIYNPTTQVSDFLFSANGTSPTLPSGFTKYKYVGSVLNTASNTLKPFRQVGNYFYLGAITDASPSSPTSGVYSTYTLSVPRINGILAMVKTALDYTGTNIVTIGVSYRITGTSIAFDSFFKPTNGYDGLTAIDYVPTNNSGQIDVAFTYTAPASNYTIFTKGFIDTNL